MASTYSNLPLQTPNDSAIVQAYDAYYNKPFEVNANVLDAMRGFFELRKFDTIAAESISVIILKQAKADGYNPMVILDTLKGLDDVELSALVSEILNYNRIKTSFLGYSSKFAPNAEVLRNILA